MVNLLSKRPLVGILFVIIISLALLSVPYGDCSTEWDIQVLDKNTVNASSISVVIDSNDNVHIAYMAYENGRSSLPIQVMYGVWNQTNWSTTKVALGIGIVDLALDSRNNPRLVFNDYRNSSLEYAQWTGEKWILQSIADSGNTASLAIDSEDKPHIAYLDEGGLKYAYGSNSSWNIQSVDIIQSTVHRVSLVLGSNNDPHILYGYDGYTVNDATIKYASMNSSGWSIQVVLSGVSDIFGNLVLDSQNYPHFIYQRNYPPSTDVNSTLIYRSWNGLTWADQVIVSKIDRLYDACQLVLDLQDEPNINFFNRSQDLSTTTLIYASLTNNVWEFQTIGGSNATGAGPIVLDSSGNPHLIYLALSQEGNRKINGLIQATYSKVQAPAIIQSFHDYLWVIVIVLIIALLIPLFRLKIKSHKASFHRSAMKNLFAQN